MSRNFSDDRPIFLQVAEGLEDAILNGAFREEEQIPSTTEISVGYKINPATALKGINLLVEDSIVYKRRGLGMFVSPGAKARIREKRRLKFREDYVLPMVAEAEKLSISRQEVAAMTERGFEHGN